MPMTTSAWLAIMIYCAVCGKQRQFSLRFSTGLRQQQPLVRELLGTNVVIQRTPISRGLVSRDVAAVSAVDASSRAPVTRAVPDVVLE